MWYEFSLYVIYSSLLSHLFFPQSDTIASLINIMFIFAIGFIARPLGTLLLGYIGDRLGRRKSLILSIILMTIPTFAIGLLPTYAAIGIAAPIFLASLRLLQSFATGGEFSGTMIYFYEIAPRHLRGFTGSLSFCSSQLGNVIASFEFFLLEQHTSYRFLSAWGWRASFIIGGLIGLLSWYLRHSLHETPLFEAIKSEGKTSKNPVREAFLNYKVPMLKAFCISALPAAGWFIIFIFSPLYLAHVLGIHTRYEILINGFLILGSSLIMPFFGHLGDSGYKKILYIFSAIGVMILSLPLYFSAVHFSFTAFVILEIAMIALLTIQFAIIPSILCELFPIRNRYTCVGIGYNFCVVLFGGASPVIALALTTDSYLLAPAFILIFSAIVSLSAFTTVKEEAHPTH